MKAYAMRASDAAEARREARCAARNERERCAPRRKRRTNNPAPMRLPLNIHHFFFYCAMMPTSNYEPRRLPPRRHLPRRCRARRSMPDRFQRMVDTSHAMSPPMFAAMRLRHMPRYDIRRRHVCYHATRLRGVDAHYGAVILCRF